MFQIIRVCIRHMYAGQILYNIPTYNGSQRSNLWGKQNKEFEQIHHPLSISNNAVRRIQTDVFS